MKNLLLLIVVLLILQGCDIKENKIEKMPATTTSDTALILFEQYQQAWHEGRIGDVLPTASKVLKEDPDFFMMNFYMAITNRIGGVNNSFKTYANNAINCQNELTEAEKLLRNGLVILLQDSTNDVTDVGNTIIEMYPNDLFSYYILEVLQRISGDHEGRLNTMRRALSVTQDSGPLYNVMGYTYMALQKYDSAEIAFDKYLESAPYLPNAYDSKGNYYRRIGEYQKAYDSYIEGYSLDTTFKLIYNHAASLKRNVLDTMNLQ